MNSERAAATISESQLTMDRSRIIQAICWGIGGTATGLSYVLSLMVSERIVPVPLLLVLSVLRFAVPVAGGVLCITVLTRLFGKEPRAKIDPIDIVSFLAGATVFQLAGFWMASQITAVIKEFLA